MPPTTKLNKRTQGYKNVVAKPRQVAKEKPLLSNKFKENTANTPTKILKWKQINYYLNCEFS